MRTISCQFILFLQAMITKQTNGNQNTMEVNDEKVVSVCKRTILSAINKIIIGDGIIFIILTHVMYYVNKENVFFIFFYFSYGYRQSCVSFVQIAKNH